MAGRDLRHPISDAQPCISDVLTHRQVVVVKKRSRISNSCSRERVERYQGNKTNGKCDIDT